MNHAFVTVRHRAIDPEVVDREIRRLASEVFGGQLDIERDEGGRGWRLRFRGTDYGLGVWFRTNRRLELRKGLGGDITSWLQSVVQNEVGWVVGGRLSDEGLPDRWEPEPEKFATFRVYFDLINGHAPKWLKSRVWKGTLGRAPEGLRAVLEQDRLLGLRVGSLLIHREARWLAEVTRFTPEGCPVIEFDTDGSIHDYWTVAEVMRLFEPWQPGAVVEDPTGKGWRG